MPYEVPWRDFGLMSAINASDGADLTPLLIRSSARAQKIDQTPEDNANSGFTSMVPMVPVIIRERLVLKTSLRTPEKTLLINAMNMAIPSMNPKVVLETCSSSVKKNGSSENTIKDAMLHKNVTQHIAHRAFFSSQGRVCNCYLST